MKLTYQTGVATLIQFIIISLLNIATGSASVITTCHSDRSNCVSNLIVSMIFFMITVAWFAAVGFLGYLAQHQRSRRLAQLLIAAEALIALVALFNAKHHSDFIGLFTSLVDLLLAAWIITLAFRLMRAGQTRIVNRQRRRPNPPKVS